MNSCCKKLLFGFCWDVFFFASNHEFSLAGLLLLNHIFSCIFQPTLQVISFLPNYTFLYLNECFSHFNVQHLLSNLSHFVLFSQAHLKITLKTKTFENFIFFSKKISGRWGGEGWGWGAFIRDLGVLHILCARWYNVFIHDIWSFHGVWLQ